MGGSVIHASNGTRRGNGCSGTVPFLSHPPHASPRAILPSHRAPTMALRSPLSLLLLSSFVLMVGASCRCATLAGDDTVCDGRFSSSQALLACPTATSLTIRSFGPRRNACQLNWASVLSESPRPPTPLLAPLFQAATTTCGSPFPAVPTTTSPSSAPQVSAPILLAVNIVILADPIFPTRPVHRPRLSRYLMDINDSGGTLSLF